MGLLKKPSSKLNLRFFLFAFNGIFIAVKTERNFIIHLIIAAIVILFGFIFHISSAEWGLILLAISGVLAAELFNSSIEKLVDMVSPARNENAGKIKDLAAGAVLITAIFAALIGLIIFIPKL
ncbi:MAG: diacylglycerol kinase family protein [Bacteroidales bacterium]|nr:diacylglycerol kinase family protein [Bacteroidales bacterium]